MISTKDARVPGTYKNGEGVERGVDVVGHEGQTKSSIGFMENGGVMATPGFAERTFFESGCAFSPKDAKTDQKAMCDAF